MSIVKINCSGKKVPVYESNAGTKQIGTLYNNELFTWVHEWAGGAASGFYMQAIRFRGSDGTVKAGWVAAKQTDKVFETNICSKANFKKIIAGKTYYGFKMRRNEPLYDNKGNYLNKSAKKDYKILCSSSTGGATHPEWLSIMKIEDSKGSNNYVDIVSGTNAFINLGYEDGSMFNSSCSLIGSM